MEPLGYHYIQKGNVVKFGDRHYIVIKTKNKDSPAGKNLLMSVEMIPFDASNGSIIVSRNHPFKKKVYQSECIERICGHGHYDECPFDLIEDKQKSIDTIKKISSTAKDFITELFLHNKI